MQNLLKEKMSATIQKEIIALKKVETTTKSAIKKTDSINLGLKKAESGKDLKKAQQINLFSA